MAAFSFDSSLIEDLDLSYFGIKFPDGYSLSNPEEGIIIRPLCKSDFKKGFPYVISELTCVGTVTESDFLNCFDRIKSSGGYYTLVVEDITGNNGEGKIIGTGTLEIEQKYIHSCALRGRLEEVVVDSLYQRKNLRKILLGILTALSKKLNCYKTTLECVVEDIELYGIFGYKEDPEKFMQLRFRD